MNIFDKAVEIVSPERAIKRYSARNKLSSVKGLGFDGANDGRKRKTWAFERSLPKDEDSHIGSSDRNKIRLEIRDGRRNLGLIFGGLDRFANGVVGTGLTPVPMTKDKQWNKLAADFWAQYMLVCDNRKRLNGREFQRQTVKYRMSEGECGYIKVSNGTLMPIESERIKTPQNKLFKPGFVDGFQLNKAGRVQAVYVCNRGPGGYVDTTRAMRVRWFNFIHPAVIDRFDQVRGIPSLHSILNDLRDKGEIAKATLFKAKLDAFMGWQVKSDDDMVPDGLNPDYAEDEQPKTGSGVRKEKHDEAEFWYTAKGDELKSLASTTPNSQYDSFSRNTLTDISMALSIPYEVLMMNMSKVSFSGGKAMLMMAYDTYNQWRVWLVDDFLQPWWNWRIGMAIITGELPAPDTDDILNPWWNVMWNPPRQSWLDEKAEEVANRDGVDLGVRSIQNISLSRGTTMDKLHDDKMEAIISAKQKAQIINKKFPDDPPVKWRDICNFGIPGAMPGEGDVTETETAVEDEKKSQSKEDEE